MNVLDVRSCGSHDFVSVIRLSMATLSISVLVFVCCVFTFGSTARDCQRLSITVIPLHLRRHPPFLSLDPHLILLKTCSLRLLFVDGVEGRRRRLFTGAGSSSSSERECVCVCRRLRLFSSFFVVSTSG